MNTRNNYIKDNEKGKNGKMERSIWYAVWGLIYG